MSFFEELKRRNVFRVGVAYLVASWLIMQVADVILNNVVAPDWVFVAILLVLAGGFPLILLFAWAFEVTPEGLKREKEVVREDSITRETGKRLDRSIIVILIAVLAYFATDKFFLSSDSTPLSDENIAIAAVNGEPGVSVPAVTAKSIAVLPMANRSANEEDQFFADGIHDDLLTQLAKIADLKVISRTSVMRYRDTDLSIPEIAEQLGVTTILEGGIQRAGNQIRMNMQLIEAQTDEHLWAETYDRQMTVENLFAIQTEIARNVVSALKATLTDDEAARIEKSPTQNLEALQEYMRGQQLLAMRNVEEMREGKARFEHALTLDPEFAPAMVGLANAYHLLYEYTEDTEEETVTPAMALLEKALVIDPELGEAYMVRGELNRHLENWEQAESDFRRALALSPGNAAAHHWFSNLRGQQGFKEESDLLLKKAHELDPMSRIIHVNVAMQPHWGERGAGDQRALDELKRVQNLHPDFYIGYMYEGWIYSNQGKPLDALRAHLKAYEIDPLNNRNGAYCWGYFNLGANDKTLSCVNEIIERHGPSGRAMALKFFATLAAEDEASAVAMLEQAIEAGPDAFYIGIWALALGDIEKATPYFSNAFPNWFSGESVDGADDLNDASSTALILNAQGEFEKAHRLISAALDTLQDRHRNRGGEAFGFDDVALLAQQGRKEEALLALRAVADLEYLSGWQFLRFHPVYDSLREEPRFIAALADLEQAAASARQQAIEEGLF